MHDSFANLRGKLALGQKITVEFLPGVADLECYAETGMRAVIVSCRDVDNDVFRMGFDFRPFDAHNAALESANYYDKNGIPSLTARESGFYNPTTPEEHIYFDADRGTLEYFKLIENDSQELTAVELAAILDALNSVDPARCFYPASQLASAKAKLIARK